MLSGEHCVHREILGGAGLSSFLRVVINSKLAERQCGCDKQVKASVLSTHGSSNTRMHFFQFISPEHPLRYRNTAADTNAESTLLSEAPSLCCAEETKLRL